MMFRIAIVLVLAGTACAPEETAGGRQYRLTQEQISDANDETRRLLIEAQRQSRQQLRDQGYIDH